MTVFDAYTEGNKDPHYDFREPDGRKANTFLGDLAKGGAKLLDEGLKGIDAATKSTLDEDSSNIVSGLRDQNIREYKELTGNVLAATSGTPSQAATGGATGPSSNSTVSDPSQIINAPVASPEAPRAVPGPISSELRMVDKMNEGMKQGHFDSERFYGEVQSRTANLISRYPGYSDYIQSKVTHYLGTDPANAQREALQQTIRQLIGTNNHEQTAAERWNHEVMNNYAAVMGPGFTQAALQAAGNPAAQNQFRVIATKELARIETQKARLREFELGKAAGTATQDDTVRTATQSFDADFSKVMRTTTMSSAGWTGTVEDVHDNLALQRLNGKPDIEANQKYALAIGDLQAKWEANFEKEWVKPRFGINPNTGQPLGSWSSDIKDPNMKEQIMKKYSTLFDSFKRQVGAGQFDLATVVADLSTRKLDNAVANLYTDPAVLALSAGTKSFGQAFDTIYGASNLRSNMALNNQISQTFLKASLGLTMANGAKDDNNLLTQAQKLKAAMDGDPKYQGQRLPAKFMETAMTNLKEVITNPSKDIPLPVRLNAVEVLSNPSTPGFLNLISKDQQFKAYGVLYAPDVTNFIKDHKATEIGDRYKVSAGESFVALYGTYANELKSAIRNDYRGTYSWDPKTNQIVYAANPGSFLSQRDITLNPAAVAVRQLNDGLRTYGSVLKAYGEAITPETFKVLGIDLNKPEGNPTLDQIKKTWANIPTKITEAVSSNTKVDVPTEPSKALVIPKQPRTLSPGDQRSLTSPKKDEGNVTSSKGDGENGGASNSPTAPLPSVKELNKIFERHDQIMKKNKETFLKGSENVTEDFINEHINRPLLINGVPVVEEQQKKDILNSLIKTKEGKYYYRQGNKLVPVNL